MAIDLPSHYSPFREQTAADAELTRKFGPEADEEFKHQGRRYVVHDAQRSIGTGSTAGGSHFYVRDMETRTNHVISSRNPNSTLAEALEHGTRVEVPAGANPRDIMIRTDLGLRSGLTPARAAEVGLLSHVSNFEALRPEIEKRGGDNFDRATRQRTPQAPSSSITRVDPNTGMPVQELSIDRRTGAVGNAAVEAARAAPAGGGLARTAGRSFGVLGGIFAGAATLVGGGSGAQAAEVAAEVAIPGGSSAVALSQNRRTEAVIAGVEELIGPLAEPLRLAARVVGADVDPGLGESLIRASNAASGEIRQNGQEYQNTLARLRMLSPEQAEAIGGDVADMHTLLRQRDGAQARMDGLPQTGAAGARGTASRQLGAAEANLREYYENLRGTPDYANNFLARLPDPQTPRPLEREVASAPTPPEPQRAMAMSMAGGPG